MCDESYDDHTSHDEKTPMLYWVSMYLVDKAYGGPEEGGWWYTCGELVKDATPYVENELPLPSCFANYEAAKKCADIMQKRINETLNVGRRSISSVLSEGIYRAQIFSDNLPNHFPEIKPHYE